MKTISAIVILSYEANLKLNSNSVESFKEKVRKWESVNCNCKLCRHMESPTIHAQSLVKIFKTNKSGNNSREIQNVKTKHRKNCFLSENTFFYSNQWNFNCVKYARTWLFSDPYFPVRGQNFQFCPYTGKFR